MALQVVLRLDESVVRIGKVFERFPGPESPVRADVEDVLGGEAEPLEQREKGIEAFAGPGTIVDADEAEAESA